MNYRYQGYIITSVATILMLLFAYFDLKIYQYVSLLFSIIGLLLTFESSRTRAFVFTSSAWLKSDQDELYYLEVKLKEHLKNIPTPRVFKQFENGNIEEIEVVVQIDRKSTVRIYSNSIIKEKVIVKI